MKLRIFCVSRAAAEYLLLRGPGDAAVPGAAAGGRAGDRGGGADHRQEADLQGFWGHRQGSSQPARLLQFFLIFLTYMILDVVNNRSVPARDSICTVHTKEPTFRD